MTLTCSGRRAHCHSRGIWPGRPALLWHSGRLGLDRSCSCRCLCTAGSATPNREHRSVRRDQRAHTHTDDKDLQVTHRIQQSVSDLLSVAVPETGAAELAPHSHALRVAAVGFGVCGFLAALVAGTSLKKYETNAHLKLKKKKVLLKK